VVIILSLCGGEKGLLELVRVEHVKADRSPP